MVMVRVQLMWAIKSFNWLLVINDFNMTNAKTQQMFTWNVVKNKMSLKHRMFMYEHVLHERAKHLPTVFIIFCPACIAQKINFGC